MKRYDVLTLFPGLFAPFRESGLIGRAIANGLVEIATHDLREQGLGRHRTVDDDPYGGGAGMVMRPEPVFTATRSIIAANGATGHATRVVMLSPQGRPFDQAMARELAQTDAALLFLCGRYEGFDERIRTGLTDLEVSLGDFVTLGGETVAMVIMEAVIRLLPGVLGNPGSTSEESFASPEALLLEYPQYTRPPEFEGMRVPEVLLSGDHGAIRRWREEQALQRTRARRPELLGKTGSKENGTD